MEIPDIIRRWPAGASRRKIAMDTGLSRDTIAKYIAAAQGAGLAQGGLAATEEQLSGLAAIGQVGPRPVETPRQDLLEPWADQIFQWLTGDRLQMTRIRELREVRGCRVSYPSLRRFILKRNWQRRSKTTVRMADTPPGAVAEVDFGRLGMITDPETGRRKAVWALIIVLGYSGHSLVWPTHGQTLEDIIAGLAAAWAFCGGIPRYLVIDNCPPAVAGPNPLHPRCTRGFLEYSQHRGFIADAARVRRPKDKPKVERGVQYVRERFCKGRDFNGLGHVRSEARRWCIKVAGQRVHGTTRRRPLVVFQLVVFQEEERHTLLPWDGEPYDIADWRSATVHPDHHIQCQQALYSVPWDRCPPGRKVEIRLGSQLVRIYHRGELIKAHVRQPKGGRSTDPDDYPAELSPYTTRSPDRIKRSAVKLGPAVAEYAERLCDGPLPWAKIRPGHQLLRLGKRYTPQRLDTACHRALDVELIDVRRLERILVQALEEEATPQLPLPLPPGRFARPGSVFAHTDRYTRQPA